MGVLPHPVSPSPLIPRVSRQGRRFATPRRRLNPVSPPTHGMTPDVVHSQTTSSALLTNTNEEQATAVPTTSLAIDHAESQQDTKKADMNSLSWALESIQLSDPASGKNASNQGTSPFCDEVLKIHGGEHISHDLHTKNSSTEGIRRGSQSALPAMKSVPLPNHPYVIPQISFTAPPTSTSLADDSQHAMRTAYDETPDFDAPYSRPVTQATGLRQENDWRRAKAVPQATHRTMSDPPPRADSRLETRSDNLDARRSSCFQYLVEYKGRLLKMIESLDSLREGGQGPPLQGGVQDKSEGSTPSKYLFEVETYADT